MAKKGKKPIDGLSEEKLKIRYPWIQGSQDALGGMSISSGDPNNPEDLFEAKVAATGSTTTREYDKENKEYNLSLNVGEIRSYTAGSTSVHNDGHSDVNSESTIRQTSKGDSSLNCKTRYTVITEGNVQAVREFCKEFCTSQSESKSFRGTFGDQVCEHSGHWHEAFEKDQVSAITKNKITMIREGDYAIHTQKGNFDLEVTSGKLHLMAKGNDLIANSNVKVLLEVGNQSKVTVQPASIKLQVGAASYIEITAGKITIKSPIIDLNP